MAWKPVSRQVTAVLSAGIWLAHVELPLSHAPPGHQGIQLSTICGAVAQQVTVDPRLSTAVASAASAAVVLTSWATQVP